MEHRGRTPVLAGGCGCGCGCTGSRGSSFLTSTCTFLVVIVILLLTFNNHDLPLRVEERSHFSTRSSGSISSSTQNNDNDANKQQLHFFLKHIIDSIGSIGGIGSVHAFPTSQSAFASGRPKHRATVTSRLVLASSSSSSSSSSPPATTETTASTSSSSSSSSSPSSSTDFGRRRRQQPSSSSSSSKKKEDDVSLLEQYIKTKQLDLAWKEWKQWMAWLPQDIVLIETISLQLIQALSDQVQQSLLSLSEQQQQQQQQQKDKKKDRNEENDQTMIAMQHALEIVETLWKLYQVGYSGVVTTTTTTTGSIPKLGQEEEKQQQQEETNGSREGTNKKNGDETIIKMGPPSRNAYTTILTMLVHVGRVDQARTMVQSLQDRNILQPNVSLYNPLIDAIVFRSIATATTSTISLDAAEQVGSIIKHMERLNDPNVSPNTQTYNSLLQACLSNSNTTTEDEEGIERADQTLSQMYDQPRGSTTIQPDEESFTIVIEGWIERAATATTASTPLMNPISIAAIAATATARAVEWLDRMEERYAPSAKLMKLIIATCCQQAQQPTAATASTVTTSTSSSTGSSIILPQNIQQVERANQLLARMEVLYKAGDNPELQPSAFLYEQVYGAYMACGKDDQAKHIKERLHQMYPSPPTSPPISSSQQQHPMGNDDADARTKKETSNQVDSSFSSSKNKNNQYYNIQNNGRGVKPQRFTSDKEILALIQEFKLQKLNYLLPKEDSIVRNNNSKTTIALNTKTKPIILSTFTLNLILKELAYSTHNVAAGQRAEDILYFMLEQYLKMGNKHVQPDIITINSVILAWSKCSHPDSAERANAILERLKDLHEKGFLLELEPDRVSYNTIIDAFANSHRKGSAQSANRVFEELLTLYKSTNTTTNPSLKPDLWSYVSLLNAFAKAGLPHRAEEVLLKMQKLSRDNPEHDDVRPNTACFNQVLYAWARSGNRDAGKRAELLLRLMEDMASSSELPHSWPNTQSYNIVLHAWSNGGNANDPYRAQILFERMKQGITSSTTTTTSTPSIRPDALSYTTLISAWCKLGGKQALEATEQLISEAITTKGVVTDSKFISNCLYSVVLSKDSEMTSMAEQIVATARNENIPVNIEVYNALLNCWAKSGNRLAHKRVMEILDHLEGKATSNSNDDLTMTTLTTLHLRPNTKTYTIVLDTLAKSRNSESIFKAEEVLKRMEQSSFVQPNVQLYTAMIQNYARSKVRYKASRAQAILKRMDDEGQQGSRPNTLTYNSVLNACEYTQTNDMKEVEEAFRIACATFDEMRAKNIKLNHVTYGSFLGVISNHMPNSDARDDLVELIFKGCIREGKVSSLVLKKLQRTVSTPLALKQLLEGHSQESLPAEWTRNVQ